LAGNVKRKYTNFFEGVMDVVSSVNKVVDDFEKGFANSIASLVMGLLTVAKDAGVVTVSGIVPDPVEPSWLKDSADETVDAYTQAALQFMQDPMRAVESAAQAFTDTIEQEGVMYATGAAVAALIPGSWAVKGASGTAKLAAGAARKAPKLLDKKPFSGNYYREKIDAAKAGMAKVKMPVFYREQLSTGDSTIPIVGMERKPLGEIRPQMFVVKNGGGGKIEAKGAAEVNRLIPGTPGKITGGNSNKLGKNMLEDMGIKRSTKWSGYQAQHIIPSEMANNPVIQKIGMNFDDSTNGVFLRVPDNDISPMSRHRGYHSVYNEVVERALNRMDINQSVGNLEKQVYDLQNNLRELQEKGLPLYPSQGATVELWERKLNQLENNKSLNVEIR
ncbi:AHH domain-containing protein, partial [Virgibacillus pantothenticus]